MLTEKTQLSGELNETLLKKPRCREFLTIEKSISTQYILSVQSVFSRSVRQPLTTQLSILRESLKEQ